MQRERRKRQTRGRQCQCAVDGNASKKWSGTHKELDQKRKKLERVAERIVQRHRERDGQEQKSTDASAEPENARRYRKKVAEIKDFLAKNDKKRGPTGNEQKSNLTDPESAKMTSSHGVIQGYNGLVAVDGHSQIVVHAEAHGKGYEAHLLAPLIEATRKDFAELELDQDVFAHAKVTADSGFHSNVVVAAVEATGPDAYIADRDYRKREPAFAGASRYKAREKKERGQRRKRERETHESTGSNLFTVKDFIYDEANARCICPAGHKLYCSGKNMLWGAKSTVAGWAPSNRFSATSKTSACDDSPFVVRRR